MVSLLKTKPIIIVTAVILLSLSSFGLYRYLQSKQSPPVTPQPTPTEETKPYEIITNPDGSQTFICYKFGFKITYPSTWEFSERYSSIEPRYTTGWVELDTKGSEIGGIYISAGSPRDATKYPTLRDLIVHLDDKQVVPQEPNITIAGLPAFRYPSVGHIGANDTLATIFETQNYVFWISSSIEKQNDPELLGIIDSIVLLNQN